MNSTNKKPPGARGVPQPFNRQAGRAPQVKPIVAQLKTGASAQSVKQPVAPPVYRPQSPTKAVQPKIAHSTMNRKPPVAPPVYRPQLAPKVLQAKSASVQKSPAVNTPRQPVAPPVYRPQPKKILQPKMATTAQAGTTPKAPPVYRPQPVPRVLQTKDSQKGAPGQRKPLAHETRLLAQPGPGQMTPTLQAKGTAINNGRAVEKKDGMTGNHAASRQSQQRPNNLKAASSRPGSNVLQAVWVDNPESPYYVWTPPVDGVDWYADKAHPELMFFIARGETSAAKYGKWQGEVNLQTRETWVKLHGSDPLKKEHNPAPISIEALKLEQAQDLAEFKTYAAKGRERYDRLRDARRELPPKVAEDREKYFKATYLNKQFGYRDMDSPEASVNFKAVIGNESVWRDPPKKGLYVNDFDLAQGRITADQNYGASEKYVDSSTGTTVPFNNSEVIYQQWRAAREILGKQAKAKLDVLRRAHIAGDGIPVVKSVRSWLRLNDDGYSEKGDYSFREGEPCFYALLATANCAAAIFLISDHGIEMNISGIETIKLCAGDSIEIIFR